MRKIVRCGTYVDEEGGAGVARAGLMTCWCWFLSCVSSWTGVGR